MESTHFNSIDGAEWYDRTINWDARLGRELPALTAVFGPPGEGGLIDAGCGTGRQATGLARLGYHVLATDMSDEMLEVAGRIARGVPAGGPDGSPGVRDDSHAADGESAGAASAAARVRFLQSSFADLHERCGGGHDGVLCLGNALAAAGSRDAVSEAVRQFARTLRPGGRLFVQILNFPPMRREHPCVRGPRGVEVDGTEFVSARVFHFDGAVARVSNVTFWKEDGWRMHAGGGTLYPIEPEELRGFCRDAGLTVDECWGSYAREPFDPDRSVDFVLVATRRT